VNDAFMGILVIFVRYDLLPEVKNVPGIARDMMCSGKDRVVNISAERQEKLSEHLLQVVLYPVN